jgi:hypothetical protein
MTSGLSRRHDWVVVHRIVDLLTVVGGVRVVVVITPWVLILIRMRGVWVVGGVVITRCVVRGTVVRIRLYALQTLAKSSPLYRSWHPAQLTIISFALLILSSYALVDQTFESSGYPLLQISPLDLPIDDAVDVKPDDDELTILKGS